MPGFELISNHLCPYTQRAAIQLAEKGIAYERVYIDLANKPEWFLQVSPLGRAYETPACNGTSCVPWASTMRNVPVSSGTMT